MKRIFILLMLLSSFSFLQSCGLPNDESRNNRMAANDNIKLGLAYLQAGLIPQAKEKLLLAVEEAPDWSAVQDAMGYFFETTGDPVTAEKYYQHALALSPEDGASLNNYGAFLCRHQRAFEAEKMFLRAAKIKDYLNTAASYENAGLCALAMRDNSKAIFYFKKALKQDPRREISEEELEKLHER